MRRLLPLLLLAACSGGTATPSTPSTTPAPQSVETAAPNAEAPTSTPAPEPAPTTTESQASDEPEAPTVSISEDADAELFVGALFELLEGTKWEDAVVDAPELFVATGYAICELLAEGESVEVIAERYVATLTSDPDDEDLRLTGVMIGVSQAELCPPA